jgi:hypothetical protein
MRRCGLRAGAGLAREAGSWRAPEALRSYRPGARGVNRTQAENARRVEGETRCAHGAQQRPPRPRGRLSNRTPWPHAQVLPACESCYTLPTLAFEIEP